MLLKKDPRSGRLLRRAGPPRGTARKIRREAWSRIRVMEDKYVEKVEIAKDGTPQIHRVRVQQWKPTFAEFTASGGGGGRHGA